MAYYPPLCGGSNGGGEGILSVMVMMHFKWALPFIHQRLGGGVASTGLRPRCRGSAASLRCHRAITASSSLLCFMVID